MAGGLEYDGASADDNRGGDGVKNLLRLAVGFGVGYLVGLDDDVGAVAASNADIAARVVDLKRAVGGQGGVEDLLVEVVLRAAEAGEEVSVMVAPVEPLVGVVEAGGSGAEDGQQDEQADEAA